METLTDVQRHVFNWIEAFVLENNYAPSVREVAEGCGFASPNAAQGHLVTLRNKGWLIKTGGRDFIGSSFGTGRARGIWPATLKIVKIKGGKD